MQANHEAGRSDQKSRTKTASLVTSTFNISCNYNETRDFIYYVSYCHMAQRRLEKTSDTKFNQILELRSKVGRVASYRVLVTLWTPYSLKVLLKEDA